jgi:hypothetical protein
VPSALVGRASHRIAVFLRANEGISQEQVTEVRRMLYRFMQSLSSESG